MLRERTADDGTAGAATRNKCARARARAHIDDAALLRTVYREIFDLFFVATPNRIKTSFLAFVTLLNVFHFKRVTLVQL